MKKPLLNAGEDVSHRLIVKSIKLILQFLNQSIYV